MTAFTLSALMREPFDDALLRVREELAEAGFGVITEIDLAATLHAKLGVDVPPQVILGACRPQLAYVAVQADSRVAAMLPCNVVVAAQPNGTRVEVFDPAAMHAFSDAPGIAEVGAEARRRLTGMLAALKED
jgi:uncharacterized protein (DUF302 family)